MKITICTVACYRNPPEFVQITDRLKAEYCFRWDIDYQRTSVNVHPGERPNWSKFQAVLDAFKSGADWAVWMDADAAPVNMKADLEGLLQDAPQRCIMQRDALGWNNGVFAIPNCERARKLMENLDAPFIIRRYRNSRFYDQTAMALMADTDYMDFFAEPPQEFGFNNYTNIYNRGMEPNEYIHGKSWCLHVPGKKDGLRAIVFKEILNQ